MRILVTGGSGKLGRWVVRDLVQNGHRIINADQRPPASGLLEGEQFRTVDLGDVGQVAGALAGCAALVHLGAIPAPYGHADEVVFANNTQATFAVLQAASLLGVSKAVIASSGSAYGMAWAETPFPPDYVPIDEEHPLVVKDPYALSKEVDERTAEMFHRRTGMSIIALRFHWVADPEESRERAALPIEGGHDSNLLGGYVDSRDAARAVRLALGAEGIGFDVFNVTAADTLSEIPTEELARRSYPGVEIRQPLPGTTSAWSSEKAGRMLGYVPQHSWRDDE